MRNSSVGLQGLEFCCQAHVEGGGTGVGGGVFRARKVVTILVLLGRVPKKYKNKNKTRKRRVRTVG